jgi:hypothetical protein
MLASCPYLLKDALFAFLNTEARHESVLLMAESLSCVFAKGTRDIPFQELYDWRLYNDRPVFMKLGHARVLLIKGYESAFNVQSALLSGPVFLGHQFGREADLDPAFLAQFVSFPTASATYLK